MKGRSYVLLLVSALEWKKIPITHAFRVSL